MQQTRTEAPTNVLGQAINSSASPNNYRFVIFLTICATYVLSYFHRAAPAVVGPEIVKELALSPTSLGIVGSMYFWAYAATALPAGILSDTWGARKTISAFVMFAGFGGLVFALGTSVPLLATGRFMIGLGFGVVYVAAIRILADWFKPNEMATYSGILVAAGNVGALISTAPLVFMMNEIGWRYSFVLVALLTFVASVSAYLKIRNKPSEIEGSTAASVGTVTTVPKVTMREALGTVFGKGKFYLIGILLFSFYGTFMGFGSLWAGPYLQHVFGLSKQVAGNVLMMFPLGMVIGCPLAGYFSDKVFSSRKMVLLWGAVIHVLSYVPILLLSDKLDTFALYPLFFWYGLTGSAFVSCFACVKEIYEPRFAGTATGALNIFLFSGGAFYQYVMGVAINSYTPDLPDFFGPLIPGKRLLVSWLKDTTS